VDLYHVGAELPRSVVGWERVRRVLEADDSLPDGHARPAGEGPASADVVTVSFAHPDDGDAGGRGLHDVTFTVPAGRTIALVGPTGAGKSTIAHLLVRLADPDAGTIALEGRDLRDVNRRALAGQATVVFQQAFLFDDTVEDNITLGAPFDASEVEGALRLAQAWDFVEALPEGLRTRLGERGTSLSGGQRQRIALARALVRRPRLMILDDATSSVDAAVESAILRGLQDAALPSTLIVIAYRRATIALADEIVFVEGGKVRARGTHEQLLASVPAYARLVRAYDAEAPS
jgi:ATP-binding cassette, subfamily B, bacterial